MKNKGLRFLILLLSLFLIPACNTQNGGEEKENPPAGEFVPEKYESNGVDISNYKIVIPEKANTTINYAASELQSYINKATGSILEIVKDNALENEYEIILGECNRKEIKDVNFELLGDESYIVKNVDKNLAIIANNKRGILYGVYSFLEALGYRYYAVDTEKIPESKDVFIPKNIHISWKPTFEYRETMFKVTFL